jgi:hypothetical protein
MRRSDWHSEWILAAFLAMLQSASGRVWAEINRWTNIGPDGGSVYALAVDPQNSQTVYASTGTGLFKTTDGGASGSAAKPGLPDRPALALVIDPQDPSTLYAWLPSGGLSKSREGGSTWSYAGLGGRRSSHTVPWRSIRKTRTSFTHRFLDGEYSEARMQAPLGRMRISGRRWSTSTRWRSTRAYLARSTQAAPLETGCLC